MMKFNKLEHEYSDEKGIYTPVGDVVDTIKRPFKKEFIAGKVAKRDGISYENVLGMWGLKGDYSTSYGNAIHEVIEYWIKYRAIPERKHLERAVKSFIGELMNLSGGWNIDKNKLFSEIIVKWDKIMVAGTIDIIRPLGDKRVILGDIKTTYDLEKGYGNFLEPYNDIKATKINEHRMQLSLYKFLAEKMGLKVEGLEIWHWDCEKFKVIKVEEIDVKPLIRLWYSQKTS